MIGRRSSRLLDQRGVALPMAMIALLLLTTLMIAFAALSQTEPVIASNHLRIAQARALAESGMERAIWALTNSSAAGLSATLDPAAVGAAPYDGSAFIRTSSFGGYYLTVTGSGDLIAAGEGTNQVDIVSIGWSPTYDGDTDATYASLSKAKKRITATLVKFPDFALKAPCALCVKGPLSTTGSTTFDARGGAACAPTTKTGTYSSGPLDPGGSSDIYGTGNNTSNEPEDSAQNQPASTFNSFTLSNEQLDALKSLAKASGFYVKPTANFTLSTGTTDWQGAAWKGNGIVFVDSKTGVNLAPDVSPLPATTDIVEVSIGSLCSTCPFTGWIIVNGHVKIAGGFGGINGMLYLGGHLNITGFGPDYISGLVVSQELVGGGTVSAGNAKIQFNCEHANGGGLVPQTWMLLAGTYREVSD